MSLFCRKSSGYHHEDSAGDALRALKTDASDALLSKTGRWYGWQRRSGLGLTAMARVPAIAVKPKPELAGCERGGRASGPAGRTACERATVMAGGAQSCHSRHRACTMYLSSPPLRAQILRLGGEFCPPVGAVRDIRVPAHLPRRSTASATCMSLWASTPMLITRIPSI